MKNLWNKIKTPIKIGALATILSFLPLKSFSQESADTTKKGYSHMAFSLSDFNDKITRKDAGTMIGIQLGYSKEIYKEVNGRISSSYSFADNKKRDFKVFMFDVGPQIEWHPTFKGENPIYFGAGFRYRYLTATNRETKDEENHSGLGFVINFGWDAKIEKTNSYFYLETEYDQIESDEDLKMGFIKLNAGIKF